MVTQCSTNPATSTLLKLKRHYWVHKKTQTNEVGFSLCNALWQIFTKKIWSFYCFFQLYITKSVQYRLDTYSQTLTGRSCSFLLLYILKSSSKITNILSLKRSTIHHLSITHKYYSEMKVFTVNYCYSHHLFISGSFWDFSELQLNCLFVVHHTVQNYDSQSATCQSILWLYRLAGDTKCEGSSRMASRGMSWMLKYTGLPKNTLHAVHNDKWR